MGGEWGIFWAGVGVSVVIALFTILGALLAKLWTQQDNRTQRVERTTHDDGRALAKLQAWRELDDRNRRRDPDDYDIFERVARLEEFKTAAEKKLDEQGPVLRAVMRLEEQFASFKREVLSRLDHLEAQQRGSEFAAAGA